MNAAFWNVRGLNRRDHQVAVKELVNEFRLNFLGLLETRVSAVNVLRVQTFLPRWSWFTDYDMPGNRIWIAWDDDLLDVDVLNLDVQFIHCRISIRCAHLSVLATVVYGANDSVSRRGLWQSLVTLADSISDEPWIVGGDFNTVVDMSEVCGASADIHLAMNEFRDCILGTGLIHLPVQGELFSWHNCSEGDRSLWKRLDRLLVNDAWLRLWPNSHYQCLNARLPITPHLCSEEILIIIRMYGGTELRIDRHNTLLLCLEKCCKLVFFKATKLEQEESQALVQSVTREEIKDAFFDIAEDKAPGPDGYSSGFYKAAWPVIGEEMIKAILEFFTTGRLLKQVNTTILALIPKRLRLVLDKLISPSQNAFVPGRSIGDNILLAQELFAGYNRQGLPMRCALKVDLRKAYDTVEWDFLSAVLQMFGFPGTFIGWVEECVTTPMFSLMLLQLIDQNEGFSFHWRCKELGLFQLCFADDLLLFCKADVASVRVFRHGLAEFAKLSGLHANPQKSQLILSRSAQDVREQLLAALHFQEGHLPLRYLGLPLLASRLSISDCKPLLLKIDSRIKGWESIQLSFAGRIQLIKSVLMSLNVYWAMAFILPKGVIREVEKKMRTFLWKGNSAVGYPKVAWNVVCKPIEEGGQGIRDILALNKALMSRHLWNVIQNNQSSIWVKWIAHTRLRHKSVWTVDVKGGSWGWRKILRLRSALLPYIEFKIGDGESFSLWHDPWHSLGSLITRFPRGPAGRTYRRQQNSPRDSILWRGGGFSTKAVYDIFRNHGPKVGWYSLLLGPCKIPRYSFVLWMAILDKLSTMDKPWLSHLGGVCVLCGREMETHEHLFFRCNYSRQCIRILKGTVRFTWPNRAWAVDIAWASKRWNGRHIVQAAYRALLAAIVYHIWQERNRRVFQQSMRPSSTIARIVVDEMRQKIISIDLPDSVSSRGLYRLWRIPWPVRGTA
ncbi:UNVERIFIED_CONTAM: putative ribonuclease H protein [Sesamum radiatum]|uniref:Ribonuclease H protein n=1 Tax=Sesamum radiatum TaxID=300843 RepID=A0AAW2JP75_SESRA